MPVSMTPPPVIRGDWPDDSIPALDGPEACEEADPSPESVPAVSPAREAINQAVPMRQQRKPTVAAWLTNSRRSWTACKTREEVEAAVLCEEACRAGKTLTGEARTRLKALIADALALHKPFGN